MDERQIFDENFRHDEVVAGSDRGFGLVLAVFFALIGSLKLWRGHATGAFET